MINNCVSFILLLITFPYLCSSQDSLPNELPYEVNRIYPYISITKEQLAEAHTLTDLYKNYKSSWVRAYISVEILTSYKGKIRKAESINDTLSQDQKDNMNMADLGTEILVNVRYMPENTLTHNDIQEINFSFTVEPDTDAQYAAGQKRLKQYLKEKAIDKIPEGSFKGFELAAVKFTIDEEGQIMDVHLFWPLKDEKIDELLLETICNMPNWKPAAYSNGTKVKQEFVLTVGSKESCVMPLLNIREY